MTWRFFGLLAAAVGFYPQASSAHLGDFVLPVYELPTSELPDLHDGTLEDWEAVVPGPSADHRAAWSAEGFVDPGDLAWRAYLAWHWGSQRLYLGIERVDDVYLGAGRWTGDRTDFAVDGDHSGGQYRDFSGQAPGTAGSNAQEYVLSLAGMNSIGRTAIAIGGFRGLWAMQEPWLEFGYAQQGEAPGRSVLEVSFTPWDTLDLDGPEESRRSTLRPNALIGLQIVLYDEDGGPDVEIQQLTPPGCARCREAPGAYAETFADAQLIPCQVADCSGQEHEPTSAAADSWGRVKASFR